MKQDIVFNICQQVLANSPEHSYRRLNPALRTILANCIEADLPFMEDTFERIYDELRGNWWFGDGDGSHVGEHFYTQSCELNHASAVQSFERFAERTACLWEESVKTSERLHVGSRFSWQGYYVTVTSMRKDSLVACTYKAYKSPVNGLKIGAVFGYDPTHLIVESKRDGKTHVLRVVEAADSSNEREVAKRFIIPYAEIQKVRSTAKRRLKSVLEKIGACNPQKDGDRLTKEINAENFRHFELEEINAAFQRRREWFADQGKVESWRKGDGESWLDVKEIVLRVKGDRVQCSNGNSVSKVAATAVLPVLLANKRKEMLLNVPIDGYTIEKSTRDTVKIRCTHIPWSEIELIVPQLN